MISRFTAALLLCVVPTLRAADEPAPPAKESKKGSLPADVLGFQGKITGTVDSVDAEKGVLKVKVTKAEADAKKNKAPKPESLVGMTILITPLEQTDKEGKTTSDAAGAAYIKGAAAGDAVTLPVRASSKGEVFRLLKVPTAGGK